MFYLGSHHAQDHGAKNTVSTVLKLRLPKRDASGHMPGRPIIEDQIQELCAKALQVKDDAEVTRILAELRLLLQEQIRRVRDRTKEVIPVLKQTKSVGSAP